MFLSIISGLLIIIPLMFIVWARSESVTIGYKISKLLSEREKLVEENQMLKKKLNQLLSPSRLRRKAQEMGFEQKQEIVIKINEK